MLDILDGGAEFFTWKAKDKTFAVDGSAVPDLKGFLIDPASLQVGWGKFDGGSFSWRWNPDLSKRVPIPEKEIGEPEWKQARGVTVYLSEKAGAPFDGGRPWQSTQWAMREAIKDLWNRQQLHDQAKEKPGKWAKIVIKGSQDVKVGAGSSVVPTLELKGWADAPTVVPSTASEPTPPEPEVEPIDDDDDPF